jgi:hypothetical protein
MRKRAVIQFTITGCMAVLITVSAVPDVLGVPAALTVFQHLGYPAYLAPFLGTAKLLGIAAVLTPRLRTLKEWAFAGLTFDVLGALYSHHSVGDGPGMWTPALTGLMLVAASYITYRSRAAAGQEAPRAHDLSSNTRARVNGCRRVPGMHVRAIADGIHAADNRS